MSSKIFQDSYSKNKALLNENYLDNKIKDLSKNITSVIPDETKEKLANWIIDIVDKFVNNVNKWASKINPDDFSVEDISSLFYIPKFISKIVCEQMVRDGKSEKLPNDHYKFIKKN